MYLLSADSDPNQRQLVFTADNLLEILEGRRQRGEPIPEDDPPVESQFVGFYISFMPEPLAREYRFALVCPFLAQSFVVTFGLLLKYRFRAFELPMNTC